MGYVERSFGRGNIWTLMFGIGFLIWGFVALRYPSVPGSYWMLIPGGILIITAISSIFTYRYNRERILGTLKSYQRVNMKQLSTELKMKPKDVKEIIVDLRAEGKLKASFDPESGDVVIFEVKGQAPAGVVIPEPTTSDTSVKIVSESEKPTPLMENIKSQGYCPYCGSKIQKSDKFCVNCGSALE